MKITIKMLEEYERPREAINFLKAYYPDGATLLEIMESPYITSEIAHKFRKCFMFSEKEEKAYNALCQITNSKNVYYCDNVDISNLVISSKNVSNSCYVTQSQDIKDSEHIYDSRSINKSDNVLNSENVVRSYKVIESKMVNDSHDIIKGIDIDWCESITQSSTLSSCSFVYKSTNLVDCWFCGFMSNSKHCLFCYGLDGAEYYIFNEKVERKQFEKFREDLINQLNIESTELIKVHESSIISGKRFEFNYRFDSVFNGLSDEFFDWMRSMPNYTNEKTVGIFLTKKFENS